MFAQISYVTIFTYYYFDELGLATKLGAIPIALKAAKSDNLTVRLAAKETLTRLGVVSPLPMKGIRILSIDGGGMKGMIALEVLRRMEAESGKRIHEVNYE